MKMGGGDMPAQQTTPKPPDPIRVPQTDDPDVAASIRKKMQEMFSMKRGRAAADLTGGGQTSGATQPYSRDSLG